MSTAAPAAPAPAPPAKLDDLMLAMDVVDTLRHRDILVERELNEEAREEQLIARLRALYKSQGIEVPDSVLKQGVEALKESRFVYTPRAAGFGRQLALLWVRRRRYGAWAAGAAKMATELFSAWAARAMPGRSPSRWACSMRSNCLGHSCENSSTRSRSTSDPPPTRCRASDLSNTG